MEKDNSTPNGFVQCYVAKRLLFTQLSIPKRLYFLNSDRIFLLFTSHMINVINLRECIEKCVFNISSFRGLRSPPSCLSNSFTYFCFTSFNSIIKSTTVLLFVMMLMAEKWNGRMRNSNIALSDGSLEWLQIEGMLMRWIWGGEEILFLFWHPLQKS